MKLIIGYFYPKLLNLYGDDGNVQILQERVKARNIDSEVIVITPNDRVDSSFMKKFNLIFMGGGPDASQKGMYKDLLENKGDYIKEYTESGGVGLFVCGSYQLLGNYYRSADGSMLKGMEMFDVYTEHFGNKRPRCVGNVVCEFVPEFTHNPIFNTVNKIGNTLVGFENHGGRTYLENKALPFATVTMGHGNNSEDSTEGCLYKNAIGTYLHGPVLARNPHLADYLIAKSLGLEELVGLNDSFVNAAHTASKTLKQ